MRITEYVAAAFYESVSIHHWTDYRNVVVSEVRRYSLVSGI